MRLSPPLSLLLLCLAPALACAPAGGSELDGMTTTTNGSDTGGSTDEGPAPECEQDSDCPAYSFCQAGMCVSGEQPDEEECYDDSDCPDGICVEYHCVPALPQLELCDPLELASTQLFTLTHPHDFDVGDVDGQAGDEIVAYHQGEIVSIAAGLPTITPHEVPYGGIRDALLLQADDDGHPDLLVAGATGSNGLRTFLGDGTGTFNYVGARYFDFELYRLAKAAAPTRDAMTGRSGGNDPNHYVFIDALADAPPLTVPSDGDPLTGDFDGDGIDELAFVDWYTVRIAAREGDTYESALTLDCQVEDILGRMVPLIADVDADGLDDLVCIHETDQLVAVSLWTSLGGLEFSRQPTVRVNGSLLGLSGNGGVAADLEGDGAPELVFGTGTFLRLGADGNFGCQQEHSLVGELKAGDLDDDGRDELISVDFNDVLWSSSAL